jgi:hypothetical protein
MPFCAGVIRDAISRRKGRSFKIPENNSRIGNPAKTFLGSQEIRSKIMTLTRLGFFAA